MSKNIVKNLNEKLQENKKIALKLDESSDISDKF